MNRAALCALLSAPLLLATAATVRAEDGNMQVRVSDVNTQTPAGAALALSRIRAASDKFCQANDGRQPLGVMAEVDKCVAAMNRKAVDQLNAPRVSALYENRKAPADATVLAVAQR
ncbi:MAG: hypothetical protein JWQ97_658 [Phenylobacterium sp.]|nr:hypothetical protein [Phenylobacterium sp.]